MVASRQALKRCLPGLALLGLTLMFGRVAWTAEDTPDQDSFRKPAYLDEMVRAEWESAGIQPSPKASDAEFLRRAYLDALGRIPQLQETVSFLESKDSGKRAKLIEHLLNHPDFAKNLATVWRVHLVGRGGGGNQVNRSALESWLRVQFSNDRPWNEISRELLTATGSNRDNGAANFVLAHMDFDKVPLTSVTTRVFLGQQIQCTQCHDHKTNDWKQADFWGINAFFKGLASRRVRTTDATGAEVDDYVEVYDRPSDAYARFDRPDGMIRVVFPTYLDGTKISQGTDADRRTELARFITEDDRDQLARAFVNRMWAHFMGRGFVHPVDDFGDHNPPSHPELLEALADDFQASGYDIKALMRWIMNSEAYQLSSVMTSNNEMDDLLYSHMALKPMTPEQLFESLLVATAAHKAGGDRDTQNRRERWLRQFLFTFATDESTESSSFQGTIPQALMMMNGSLIQEATSGRPGSFLRELLDQSRSQRGSAPDLFVINRMYLAALTRPPSTGEINMARTFLRNNPDPIGVMQDIFWALLNSNEFILNH